MRIFSDIFSWPQFKKKYIYMRQKEEAALIKSEYEIIDDKLKLMIIDSDI